MKNEGFYYKRYYNNNLLFLFAFFDYDSPSYSNQTIYGIKKFALPKSKFLHQNRPNIYINCEKFFII